MATNNSGLSKRAALRQQQEAEARDARNKKILGIVLGAIALVVVVVLGIVVFQTLSKNTQTAGEQSTPPNGNDKGGIALKSTKTQPAGDVPHVVVYEDYQCPACASREQAYGPAVEELVDAGKITFEVSTTYFLDDRIGNDSSQRASMAAAAADAVGKYREMHKLIYANQPQHEGTGYTDQQLRVDIPAQAGITGDDLAKYQQLYDSKAFRDFAKLGDERFTADKIGSTPTYVVNGQQLKFYDEQKQEVLIQPTADDFLRAVTEANG